MTLTIEPWRAAIITGTTDDFRRIAADLEKAGPSGPYWWLAGHLRSGYDGKAKGDEERRRTVSQGDAWAIAQSARRLGIDVTEEEDEDA